MQWHGTFLHSVTESTINNSISGTIYEGPWDGQGGGRKGLSRGCDGTRRQEHSRVLMLVSQASPIAVSVPADCVPSHVAYGQKPSE